MDTVTNTIRTMKDNHKVEQSKSNHINLSKPTKEILSRTAARIIEQSVGASTWTSGNQTSKGIEEL